MSSHAVRLHDMGTTYRVPIYDNDLAPETFDPSSASVKRIRFQMPGAAAIIERPAVAVQRSLNGLEVWVLEYTVGSTAGDDEVFHTAPGDVVLQGYLEFSPVQKWHGNEIRTDQQGRALEVLSNL